MELNGAKALVTGGSEGIGFAIANALKEQGARVGITGRNQEKLSKAASDLGLEAYPGDVGNEDDTVRTVNDFVSDHDGIDILINNAGFGRFSSLVETQREDFESVFRTNVTGAMLMARECAKRFIAQSSGNIVNISSTSGLHGGKGSTAYSGSKFALRGMTECWRAELRPHNIRVILVNPSEVQTPFFSKLGLEEREFNPKKLRGQEIADAVVGALRIDDRGFIPEFSVFATNPF